MATVNGTVQASKTARPSGRNSMVQKTRITQFTPEQPAMLDLNAIPPIVASVIGGILWLLVNRVLKKIDAIDQRFSTIDTFMRTELRLLDVRVSVVEQQIKSLVK